MEINEKLLLLRCILNKHETLLEKEIWHRQKELAEVRKLQNDCKNKKTVQ